MLSAGQARLLSRRPPRQAPNRVRLAVQPRGCPVAVEVFDGNTADPSTVGVHIEKLRQRFALSRVVLVGDRGMLTEARIREEVAPAGLDWISALRAPAIRELMSSGAVQRSMFDDTDLAEVRCDAYPGERLIVCRNERLAQERARKREALLQATQALLAPIAAATQREKRRLSGKEKIAMRVGKVIGKYKMAKHFELDITETAFAYHRKADAIATEAALDGLYIVRTSVPPHRARCRAHRARLQGIERRRARVPQPQNGGPESAPDLSLRWRARARPRLPVHARLLCRMAHAPTAQTVAVRRRGARRGRGCPPIGGGRRPKSHHRPKTKPDANAPPRASVCTASGPCSTIWPRLPTTASSLPWLMPSPSTSSLDRPALQRKAFKLLGVRLERTQ